MIDASAQAAKTHAMLLANVTEITDAARASLGGRIADGSRLN
jgi:uncharacterized membrane protein